MSSASGVVASDECVHTFNDLKLKKKYRFVTYKIDGGNIVPDVLGTDRSVTWPEFVKTLPNEPRYVIFDYDFKTNEAQPRDCNKIVFLNWVPDSSGVKLKMVAASSKEAIRKKFEGVLEHQANDIGDADESYILAKCQK
eukprot:NODE_10933_length_570_cov_144.400447_g10655_i0.p1 GENE.NODE_10933_length_570_cov_144.400447_g10655_i0~~NODE_10933_length_570_cov_144.400447_g10655_i0.p1  ORF type:complete len:155 (+),score=57.77 NODE_10933_length_570_cov_144.400447_g10655_i0:51-467(+)